MARPDLPSRAVPCGLPPADSVAVVEDAEAGVAAASVSALGPAFGLGQNLSAEF
jgi:hypothetical protein